MTDAKIIERIGKLLRLAAPSSGTTAAERANAALEAAKLIDEHGVAMQATRENGEKKNNGNGKKTVVAQGVWVKTMALDRCSCSCCGNLISKGDVVWFRSINYSREYRHDAGPCRVA